ncbi:MAG: hypothetical protein ABW212_02740 [Pseudonocardia sediminis]
MEPLLLVPDPVVVDDGEFAAAGRVDEPCPVVGAGSSGAEPLVRPDGAELSGGGDTALAGGTGSDATVVGDAGMPVRSTPAVTAGSGFTTSRPPWGAFVASTVVGSAPGTADPVCSDELVTGRDVSTEGGAG